MTQPLDQFLARVRPPLTPALVVRRRALEANLRTMQEACDAVGVRLRAHGKMHKCSRLAALQVAGGAVGLCCQTIGEAEAYAASGVTDLLLTSPVAPWAMPRLAALADEQRRIGLVVDEIAQIEAASRAAAASGSQLAVVVDINLGHHRTGARPEQVVPLARAIAASTALRFAGVQAYLGHLQHVAERTVRADANAEATEGLRAVIADLKDAGLPPPVVTGGGTGTFSLDLAAGVFTELQAGSYALMDVEYLDCGAPDGEPWAFEPALFLAASVVSAQRKTHATCDAGLKAVATDGPDPRIVAGAPENSIWQPMGDEHGAIVHPSFLPALAAAADRAAQHALLGTIERDPDEARPLDLPGWGDLVWLIPGHVDPTINLHDALFVAEEDGRLERWPVDARRRTA